MIRGMKPSSIVLNTIKRTDYEIGILDIPAGSIDMILCDPPYGVTDCSWDIRPNIEFMWREFNRILKPNGAAVITATQPFATDVINANRKCFRYDLVWAKSNPVGFLNANRMPLRQHELVLVFYRSLPDYHPQITPREGSIRRMTHARTGRVSRGVYRHCEPVSRESKGKYPTSILPFAKEGAGRGRHPTQKPISLFEFLIKSYSNPGDVVFDPFMGSGTTAVAAINTDRQFYGFEREQEYIEMSRDRIRDAHAARIPDMLPALGVPRFTIPPGVISRMRESEGIFC
jgi:site-specific DNA-methyltransferase (adenine-specific)